MDCVPGRPRLRRRRPPAAVNRPDGGSSLVMVRVLLFTIFDPFGKCSPLKNPEMSVKKFKTPFNIHSEASRENISMGETPTF
jgi:hypothetical protein